MIPLIRPATREVALEVASRLRKADEREVWAATGHSPEEVLPLGVETAREAYVCYAGDVPATIFGVTDDANVEGMGLVWLLATDDVFKIKQTIFQDTPLWLDHWGRKYYPLGLHNIADERNRLHLKWILRVGFQFGERVWIGDHSFRHFIRYHEVDRDV